MTTDNQPIMFPALPQTQTADETPLHPPLDDPFNLRGTHTFDIDSDDLYAPEPATIFHPIQWFTEKWANFMNWIYTQRLWLANRLLLYLDDTGEHVKHWRPNFQILGWTDETEQNWRASFELVAMLKAGGGFTIASKLMETKMHAGAVVDEEALLEQQDLLTNMIRKVRLDGWAHVVPYENASVLPSAVWGVIQAFGLSVLTPNTLVVQYPLASSVTRDIHSLQLWHCVHQSIELNRCLIMPRGQWPGLKDRKLQGTIDIWWILHDGGVVLLFPFLLRKQRLWEDCRLRIFAAAVQEDQSNLAEIREKLQKWLYMLRIDAALTVIPFKYDEIRPYSAERTTQMEQRKELLSEAMSFDTAKKQQLRAQPQLILDECMTSKTDDKDIPGHLKSQPSSDRDQSMTASDDSEDEDEQTTTLLTDYIESSFTASDSIRSMPSIPPNMHHADEAPTQTISIDSPTQRPTHTKSEPVYFDEPRSVAAHKKSKPTQPASIIKPVQAMADYTMPRSTEESEFEHTSKTSTRSHHLKSVARGRSRSVYEVPSTADEEFIADDVLLKAETLNSAIMTQSSEAQLVVINMPRPPTKWKRTRNYVQYLDGLTKNLKRVLLIRGSNQEVITFYN